MSIIRNYQTYRLSFVNIKYPNHNRGETTPPPLCHRFAIDARAREASATERAERDASGRRGRYAATRTNDAARPKTREAGRSAREHAKRARWSGRGEMLPGEGGVMQQPGRMTRDLRKHAKQSDRGCATALPAPDDQHASTRSECAGGCGARCFLAKGVR
jgi:hypothetical protein